MRFDRGWVTLCAAVAAALPVSAATGDAGYRFEASIAVAKAAPFVALPLTAAVYARSVQGDLADLRVVDAGGERVPFALLGFRDATVQTQERATTVTIYALPKSLGANRGLPESVDLVVLQPGRIELRQRGKGSAPDVASSAGWLIDLGERLTDAPPVSALRLRWPAPTDFSIGYGIEGSADLRTWQRLGGGQLMSLRGADGQALMQNRVPLPPGAGRFVRLTWADAAKAPRVEGAEALVDARSEVARDAPTKLTLQHSAEPAGKVAAEPRALHLDLGGVLPIAQLDIALPAGAAATVMPLRVQQRNRVEDPWQTQQQAVVYRIERGGEVDRSPPLRLHTRARYLRLVPDERAPGFDAAHTGVIAELRLATLVFASQGHAPYTLQVGSTEAAPGALAIESMMSKPDDERPRFGVASLGEFSERAEAAQAARRAQAWSEWRPRALWAVLLIGVAGLGWMVWRLARAKPA